MTRCVSIRRATAADLPAMAALQIASWQDAYRGIVPDGFLDQEVPDLLIRHWSQMPGPHVTLILAENDGGLAGFAATDHEKAGGRGAYIDNFHVHPGLRRQGIGQRLMAATAEALIEQGETRVWLTVLDKNVRARTFYRSLGGIECPIWGERMHGQPVESRPIEWHDLPALAARARALVAAATA